VADPCWRRLLRRPGVDFGPLVDETWDLELADGDRCRLLTGAHDLAPNGLPVDYSCESGLTLVRNLRRGRVWKIGAYRYDRSGYHAVGDVTIRRGFQGHPAAGADAAAPLGHRGG
jgi:hypothetical protein